MSNHLSRALTVVKATTRLKLIAKHARDARERGEDPENVNADGVVTPPPALAHIETPLLTSENGDCELPPTPLVRAFKNPVTRDLVAAQEMVFSSYFNLLLVCWPLGIASYWYGWGAIPDFFLNFAALIPLALILGDITEDLALRFGDVVGGLVNATFGNVVEIVLSVIALEKGLYDVVATSLMGSILSNLLLVLGSCFLVGGMRYKTQSFNELAITACSSLLFLASIALVIPTAATRLVSDPDVAPDWILDISRGVAVVLLILYFCFLAFQLYTHHDMFSGQDDDDADDCVLTLPGAITLLTLITLMVALSSEFLSESFKNGVAEKTGMSRAFMGLIILPIAGNACEHITAIIVAAKNKMDLSMGIAVGSSIQIAIFAIPFIVIVAWCTGHEFALNFDPFAVMALTVSVIHAQFITTGGVSHWFMGVQLISVYVIIAITFLYR